MFWIKWSSYTSSTFAIVCIWSNVFMFFYSDQGWILILIIADQILNVLLFYSHKYSSCSCRWVGHYRFCLLTFLINVYEICKSVHYISWIELKTWLNDYEIQTSKDDKGTHVFIVLYVDVYCRFCGLLQFPGEVRRKCLSTLCIFLCHRYPKVSAHC